jgi:iron complex outermembrane receptor protein
MIGFVMNLMRVVLCFLLLNFISFRVKAQTIDSLENVSLDSVVIGAYGSKNLMRTAAAVNKIGWPQLQRFNGASVLQAVNTTAGVRMEERSPGSYRFNIRGSAVRSPYGVRNIKIYYEGIPFTAPGGNSMLNMLGVQQIGGIEIIKGPGSSLYGAGTGGVILLESPVLVNQTAVAVGASLGSFGSSNYQLNAQLSKHRIVFEETNSDGYRTHTEMKRRVAAYQTEINTFRNASLSAHLIYSDLNYQTPGALTASEYLANPKQARPNVGATQGAELANAGIAQEAFLLGLSHRYAFAEHWSNNTSIYGFYNSTANPAIQNYELKKEPHWGARTAFMFTQGNVTVQTGAELQRGDFSSKTYRNLQGQQGAQLTDDQLDLWQWLAFTQLNWKIKQWVFTAGASINSLSLDFFRAHPTAPVEAEKRFNAQWQPRFAVLYQAGNQLSMYLNIARGFSPPASSEIFADNNSYNLALQAEQGWNIEPGLRWMALKKRLFVEASYFHQSLGNAIVTRRDAAGANYFINAGKTQQQGVETSIRYEAMNSSKPLLISFMGAYTWHHFRYLDFIQLNQNFSGNRLPGVPENSIAITADVKHKSGIFGFITFNHQSNVALNDANSEYAAAFDLISLKLGYQGKVKHSAFQVFAGTDNLLNQRYSLGNDINGFGGRYYNAAPGRSFYLGLRLSLVKR